MRDAPARKAPSHQTCGDGGVARASASQGAREDVRLVVYLHHRFERAARQANLTMTQYWTLAQLADRPRRATEIASTAGVTKPTVSVMLANLHNLGLTVEVPSLDGRSRVIALSEGGRHLLSTLEADMADHFDAVVAEDLRRVPRSGLEESQLQNPIRRAPVP
jgi:DNA-binding MarR family transcriptional regulator